MSIVNRARRRVIISALSGVAVTALARRSAVAAPPEITVYRSDSCECCHHWIEYMRIHGFAVRDSVVDDLEPIKGRLGVPVHLRSCHTAVIDSFVIEGHVPAADVKRVLIEQPPARGLAVPGMPLGSPGMENPAGRHERFAVILFADGGRERVFARY